MGDGVVKWLLLFAVFIIDSTSAVGVKVDLISEGCNDPGVTGCGMASIKINGIERSYKQRGYNFVVLDFATGKFETYQTFDTYKHRSKVDEMRNFINQLPPRKVVLIAVQDDASKKMTSADYVIFDKIGGRNVILKEYFRSSYALVGYTGPDRPSWIKQEQRDRYKGPSKISTEVPFGEFPNIDVISEGCSDQPRSQGCGLASIYIDGEQKALQTRGHNFVVINALTGKFEQSQTFDTHSDSQAASKIATFIGTVPNGRVVVVAVQDEGSTKIGNTLEELKKIGAREPVISEYRSSFALIGYKGVETPKWITQSQKKSKKGPSFASAFVPFGPSAAEGSYIVTTYTGDVKDASTNAKVYIKFTGANGDSREVELTKTGSAPFQQGGTNAFRIHLGEIGEIRSVRIRQDNSKVNPSWFLAALSVKDVRLGKTYMYQVEQWLQDGKENGGKPTLALTLNQPAHFSVASFLMMTAR